MTTDANLSILRKKKKKYFTPPRIIVLGFLGVILLGSFLLSLPISTVNNVWTPYLDSLFTATSAVCVTGLIVLPTAVHFSIFGQVVIILLIQTGGLGVMTLSTLLLMLLRRKITLKDRLVMQEAFNQDNLRGIVKLARNVVILTFVIEGFGALIFMPVFIMANGTIGIWQAVFTAISAFCNAGFDIFGTIGNEYIGLTGYVGNGIISVGVALMIILGGLGFTVIIDLVKNKFNMRNLSLHTKIVFISTICLIVSGTLAFFFMEYNNMGTMGGLKWYEKILASFFQSVTCRTAGYNTIDQNALTLQSKLFSMLLMFIGASPGSTGGGVKTSTFAIVILVLLAGLRKDDEIVINKHSISQKMANKSVAIVCLSGVIIIVLSMLLMITEKNNVPAEFYSFENIFFEAFSAYGTVGLTCGMTPFLSNIGKIAVAVVMFFGRVGPLTIGLMFLSKKNGDGIKYPEGYIMVG